MYSLLLSYSPCYNGRSIQLLMLQPPTLQMMMRELNVTMCSEFANAALVWSKDLRGNPKPRVSPDRTGPKPVRGRGTFLRIFSFRVGSGNFISGRSGSGYFLPGYGTFSPGISGINLSFIPKLRKKNGYPR